MGMLGALLAVLAIYFLLFPHPEYFVTMASLALLIFMELLKLGACKKEFEHVRKQYSSVPVYPSLKEALAAFPASSPPEN